MTEPIKVHFHPSNDAQGFLEQLGNRCCEKQRGRQNRRQRQNCNWVKQRLDPSCGYVPVSNDKAAGDQEDTGGLSKHRKDGTISGRTTRPSERNIDVGEL